MRKRIQPMVPETAPRVPLDNRYPEQGFAATFHHEGRLYQIHGYLTFYIEEDMGNGDWHPAIAAGDHNYDYETHSGDVSWQQAAEETVALFIAGELTGEAT
jgi:hypothetical protein